MCNATGVARSRPDHVPRLSLTLQSTAHSPLTPYLHEFDRLVALLPCQSLEDFDLQRKEEDAEQLLSAWSALWHPLLLASARAIPRWLPAASPPQSRRATW